MKELEQQLNDYEYEIEQNSQLKDLRWSIKLQTSRLKWLCKYNLMIDNVSNRRIKQIAVQNILKKKHEDLQTWSANNILKDRMNEIVFSSIFKSYYMVYSSTATAKNILNKFAYIPKIITNRATVTTSLVICHATES